jgi:imidazolonepropionase
MRSTSNPVRILRHGRLATMTGADGYGLIENGEIVIRDGRIVAAGPSGQINADTSAADIIDLEGRLVTPGLIDCHTHLIHAGSRAREFEMRLEGATYEQIAQAGGGIFSTVQATRQASEEDLLSSALSRLDAFLEDGVTTIEIKSGYGLDWQTERKMLRTARRLEQARGVRVRTTFLGAHAVPVDLDANTYLDEVCLPAMRALADEGLIDAVDGFCESIAFSPAQIERLFVAARDLGLPIKLHAEQLSALGGSALAARFGALSADHLEYATESDVAAMQQADTVAVILPGAYYFLRETRKPPIEMFRAAGVPMAVATDCNPGSSPMTSPQLAMNMAATLFGMTPSETLRGVTVNAARALGLSDLGRIEEGHAADLAVWDVTDPAELTYRIGGVPNHMRIFGGIPC